MRNELPAGDEVLNGSHNPPPNLPPETILLIQELALPRSNPTHPHVPFKPRQKITIEDHIKGWRRSKENTAAGMSGITFAMFKAHLTDPHLVELDVAQRNLACTTGFSYRRWKKGLDVQLLLKRKRDYRAEKLRAILLLEADFNQNNKILGSDVMRLGERNNILTRDNYGGRKHSQASEVGLNQLLTHNSVWARRGRAIIMSNDAKGCYDRIAHIVVSLAMQRLGAPKPALASMLETIQEMSHHVRTAFGISPTSYGNETHLPPPSGILQGNGAGPAGWFAISTVLIDAMKKSGFGYNQWTLIRKKQSNSHALPL